MKIDIRTSPNADDLQCKLTKIDTRVCARTDGRTTEQTEVRTICRLLSTLTESNSLAFPVSLLHGDRPDFCLTESSSETGIEVTEATSQQWAAYCALAAREFPDALLELSHFRWGAPELTTEQMRELLRQDRLSGEGWVGDTAEREWALYMKGVIDVKLAKMKKEGYRLHPQNKLSIYDNLPLPNIDIAKAVGFLTPMLQPILSQNDTFNAIYVEHGHSIIEITTKGVRTMEINDLWRS